MLTPKERLIRGGVALAAALLIGFILNLTLVSQLQYAASQQQLRDHFSAQLADGVAPVSEGDLNGVLLDDGVPVAQLQLPSIGLDAVVVEGSSSAVTTTGPGHRRDTALPGQAGTSVIIGRAAAFGGPFSRIQELQPGDTFTVTTGQGEHTFEVMGLRYAGDPSPPRLKPGESRVVLESARGLPFTPTGVARVDARLVGDAVPTGARQTSFASLPPEAKAMSTDTTSVWALVFGLQALVVAELALMWALQRIGPRHTWTVFVPILLLIGLIVTAQIVSLLPNVL